LDGTLYVNNVLSNNLYRIPVDAAGKAGQPVDIWMDQTVKGPDGMRAANGKLLLAENGIRSGSPNAALARQCLFRCRNDGEMMMELAKAALLFTLASVAA
jgi:sugar lactone lactonase YvrE